MKLNIPELDCVFISYDEPNAEANWGDLLDKCVWAKRVHGVKGSDACHKAAAELSDTEWFVTVDADNIVNTEFFDKSFPVPYGASALSWPGVNIINGLRYGNGSLKVWKKEFVLKMRSHEADGNSVDFCWESGYFPMLESYSVTYPNSSPYHAWRAGFREGVKMSLYNGVKVKDKMHWHNLHRLKVWSSVGAHVDNGLWAMLGARHGCYKTTCTDWNYVEVRDFDYLNKIWEEVKDINLLQSLESYEKLLKEHINLEVTVLDRVVSEFTCNIINDQYLQMIEQATWTNKRNNV